MTRTFLAIVTPLLMSLPSQAKPVDALSKDEAAIVAHIKALHDEKSEVRAAAAEALRLLVAKYPSRSVYLRSKDAGEAAWTEKVNQVKPGMTRDQVLKVLPRFPEGSEGGNMASGQRNWDWYSLDYHWTTHVLYDNGKGRKSDREDTVSERPILTRRAVRVHVEPAKNYTGKWITWYVNGEKGYEVQYLNGKYNGAHTHFYDNGQACDKHHYNNGVLDGPTVGWHRDGKNRHTGRYRKGEQDGRWLYWYANGMKQSDATYLNGKFDGGRSAWHENGQITSIQVYRNGVKHGLEVAWNEAGIQQYKRYYENGSIVFP